MPRIDPNQLLKCLTVLLSPKGGIKSKDEVSRLASLMTKFSKKLVSKCIYVMILKATETDFLDTFMSVGGWDLTFNWLSDGIAMKNWPLVAELVELLIICPVDIERLKGNNCPKLIKLLSKDPSASEVVRQRACNVVDKWLAIVKGACENNSGQNSNTGVAAASEQEVSSTTPHITENGVSEESNEATVPKGVYKITIRNGKKVLAEVISGRSEGSIEDVDNEDENEGKEEKPSSERPILKVVNEDPIAKESLPPKKLAEGKKHQLSLKRKNEKKVSPEPEKKSLKEKKKNNVIEKKPKLDLKSKTKEKKSEKEKAKLAKEKSPEEKAQEEKDKQNLMKLITPSIGNLGKIPKKSKDDSKKEEKKSSVLKSPTDPKKPLPKDPKKYNISIETRKGEDRPKTVKTFNSRFRSTGLEELPPPPKSSKKKEEPPVIERKPVKRPSPIKEIHIPEKKAKEEEKPEKPQVLSPSSKPKISGLQESDVFADALTAANPVKDVKKRKRRPSNSSSQGPSEPKKENNANSKSDEKETVKPVFKFYQDTLITSEEKSDSKEEGKEERDDPESPTETYSDENVTDTLSKEELEDEVAKAEQAIDHVRKLEEKKNVEREKNRLAKGILIYMKKSKSTKKTVTFRDQDLVTIKHFELDENERVNVTKTFMDMRQMEKFNERILFQRKLASEDIMEEKTPWRPLIPIDIPSTGETIIPGQNSVEKDIQHARERTTLQAIYFNRSLIPDSPLEPDLEIHAMTEPAVIPLKDTTGNPDSVLSYRDKPWPEPKGYPPGDSPPRTTSPPHLSPHHVPVQQPMMQQQPPQQMVPLQGPAGMYPQQYPPQGNMQPFMPPALLPTPSDWMANGDGNMMMGGPPGNDQMMMGGMNPGPGMPPGLLPPPDMYNMSHPHSDFMGPPYTMGGPPQGMYPGGPPGGFSHHQDGGPPNPRNPRPWFRGQDSNRGGGSGGTWRHPSKGGGGWNPSNKMCKFYLKKGICRQNNCAFRHGSGKGGIR